MTDNATNNTSLLLEIGTEDLPARFISPAMQQLKDNAETILKESGEDLLEFIDFFENNEWAFNTQILNIKEFINHYGLDKLALVMISDEQMGGYLPSPNYDEIVLEMEYH